MKARAWSPRRSTVGFDKTKLNNFETALVLRFAGNCPALVD